MPDPQAGLPELFDLDWGSHEDDFSFYENFARLCGGPALELGVGTGRVAIPLASAGFEVWGIDISEDMLERARCKAGPDLLQRLRLFRADIREFELDRSFDFIFAAFGTFHHLLTVEDQTRCLRRVHGHLAPGGLFVCDLRPWWHAEWEEGTSVPLLHEWTRGLGGDTVTKMTAVRPDRARQLQHETHIFDRLSPDGTVIRTVAQVDLRFSTRYEMEGLFREAGMELEHVYGDYDLSPFDESSPYLITVARKPAKDAA